MMFMDDSDEESIKSIKSKGSKKSKKTIDDDDATVAMAIEERDGDKNVEDDNDDNDDEDDEGDDDRIICIPRSTDELTEAGQAHNANGYGDSKEKRKRRGKTSICSSESSKKQQNLSTSTFTETTDPSHLSYPNYQQPNMKWSVSNMWDCTDEQTLTNSTPIDHILKLCDDVSQATSLTKAQECTQLVVRNLMALQDRYVVEFNILRRTVTEELFDSRSRVINLLHELRQHSATNQYDTQTMSSTNNSQKSTQPLPAAVHLSQAMSSVLTVQSALRGVYPHVSYAHAHHLHLTQPTPNASFNSRLKTKTSSK